MSVLVHRDLLGLQYSAGARPWESALRYRRGWSALPHHSASFLQRARFRYGKDPSVPLRMRLRSAGDPWPA
jgi:hypothetical protein